VTVLLLFYTWFYVLHTAKVKGLIVMGLLVDGEVDVSLSHKVVCSELVVNVISGFYIM
jgi:hypothetical protein